MSLKTRLPIRLLKENTINQIAAGEVIENSASVVKELIENSLDAGANDITIETKAGGRHHVRISDNGHGMTEEDLLLCIERHATSKISDVNDLETLKTLGFRGEALPSIASVSKFSIHSKTTSGQVGSLLTVEGGKILGIRTSPRAVGTTVEVNTLFYNVPVRKKFQKSVAWDTGEIHKVITKAALCYPEVKWSWVHDEKKHLELLPLSLENLEVRIESLLGKDFAEHLVPLHYNQDAFQAVGFISKASYHRPNKLGQYLFVNHRPVISPLVANAILEGYGHRLPAQRFPLFILHIHMPASWIDVNVHPQKKEIRFRNEEQLHDFLVTAAEQSLQKKHMAVVTPSISLPKTTHTPLPLAVASLKEESTRSAPQLFPQGTFHILKRIGSYLFVEASEDKGFIVVDEKAARARVLFENMIKQSHTVESQQLLLPLTLDFTGSEAKQLTPFIDALNILGLSIRPFGGSSFVVDALPLQMNEEDIKEFLLELLDEGGLIAQRKEEALAKKLALFLVKKKSSCDEGKALVEALFKCEISEECPQGKPTYIRFNEEELTTLFKKLS